MIERVSVPYTIEGHQLRIGASIGIAIAGPHEREAGKLLRRADEALYLSRAAGRGTYHYFEEEEICGKRGARRMLEREPTGDAAPPRRSPPDRGAA